MGVVGLIVRNYLITKLPLQVNESNRSITETNFQRSDKFYRMCILIRAGEQGEPEEYGAFFIGDWCDDRLQRNHILSLQEYEQLLQFGT